MKIYKFEELNPMNEVMQRCVLCKDHKDEQCNKKTSDETGKPIGWANSKNPIAFFAFFHPTHNRNENGYSNLFSYYEDFFSDLDNNGVEFYVTNCMKCTPNVNSYGKRTDLINCFQFLEQELIFVNPKILFAVGKEPENFLNYRLLNKIKKEFNLTRINSPTFCYHNKKQEKQEYLDNILERYNSVK